MLFFLVSRSDVSAMKPAEDIDPTYAKHLRWAAEEGVEILAYKASLESEEVGIGERMPVLL